MAIVLAAATGGVGVAAGELEDALAQDWFWSPSPTLGNPEDRQTRRSKKAEDSGVLKDALAQDWFWSPSPILGNPEDRAKRSKKTKAEDEDRERIHLLLFSGVDLWRHSAFAHDGLQWMPAGAGNDGVVFKVLASAGSYQYRSGALGNAEVTGWMTNAAVMPGLYFKRHGVSATLFAGVDFQTHILSRFDPGNDLQGRHVGARIAIDLWAEPTAESMITGSATLTTIGGQYAARAAGGWRLLDAFYFGPEVSVYGGPEYRQLRFGAHVTALRTQLFRWRFEWQGAAGIAFDDDGNSGPYARVGILVRH